MKYSRRQVAKILLSTGATALLGNLSFAQTKKTTMHKRPIPTTGELLPCVGLGTWQTFDVGPSPVSRKGVKEVLSTFAQMGGTLVDSSPMYGQSEEVVGDLAVDLGLQKKLFMATKVWTQGEQAGIKQMQTSMREMQVNPMDLMQIHNLVDWQVHLKTLRRWKEEKRIRYIGITHYLTSAFDNLEQIIKSEPIDFVQLNYNIVTREAANRLLPLAAEKKVAVIVNRPFETGSLFSAVRNKELPGWAADFDCKSWGQFFLKYILGHPAVTCVIPATAKVKHLTDNMGAGIGRFPDEALRKKMEDYIQKIT
ncbi:aldo/keto reductase [Adhaeribacter aquaticus]|uniref:aldo/keto reductase n=1 Tax=Adhaeribacter aquaticus TaxID=299567 RepID=UPI0003FA5F4A|nr:aldo/keto reductase [Adhaeribacter aquaticus]